MLPELHKWRRIFWRFACVVLLSVHDIVAHHARNHVYNNSMQKQDIATVSATSLAEDFKIRAKVLLKKLRNASVNGVTALLRAGQKASDVRKSRAQMRSDDQDRSRAEAIESWTRTKTPLQLFHFDHIRGERGKGKHISAIRKGASNIWDNQLRPAEKASYVEEVARINANIIQKQQEEKQ